MQSYRSDSTLSFLRDVIEDLEKEQEEGAAARAQPEADRLTRRRGQRPRPPSEVKRQRTG